jgi:molybdate transport system ATP-binding protein
MPSTLLSANAITVKFGALKLFTNLNFVLNKGENWVLKGRSGSGKSVLLQTLAGNIAVGSGMINYHFLAFVGARHNFKNLSNTGELYYQQRFNSSDSEDALTVRQYLSVIKTNNHAPAYWTFNKTVKLLNLDALVEKQTIKLSNGETKRLMMAAALLKNPLVLLLDNPMTGLDADTRQSFNTLLNEIVASGISIVMANSGPEVPDCITHVAVLEDGVIK